jgi:hypothetical protein
MILSHARLPVPPLPHVCAIIINVAARNNMESGVLVKRLDSVQIYGIMSPLQQTFFHPCLALERLVIEPEEVRKKKCNPCQVDS